MVAKIVPKRSSKANAGRVSSALPERTAIGAYRIVDWTRLTAAPAPADVERLLNSVARDGSARLAVLVSKPKVLRAATVFAEQAELHGAQVRVFVGAKEAADWLYRDLSPEELEQKWNAERPANSNPFRRS